MKNSKTKKKGIEERQRRKVAFRNNKRGDIPA